MHSRAFLGVSQPRTFLGMAGVPRLLTSTRTPRLTVRCVQKNCRHGALAPRYRRSFPAVFFICLPVCTTSLLPLVALDVSQLNAFTTSSLSGIYGIFQTLARDRIPPQCIQILLSAYTQLGFEQLTKFVLAGKKSPTYPTSLRIHATL